MKFKYLTFCWLVSISLTGCFSTLKSNQTIDSSAISQWQKFDYTDWTNVLSEHVNDKGLVNYTALKKNRTALDRFVALLGSVGPNTRPDLFKAKEQKLAYYINAYNAFTMFNIINSMPKLVSVNDNLKKFFYFTEFPLDGKPVSLYNLENKIIRPQFEEPRIHFALNCASMGCPKLPNKPFLPETLEAQLHKETQFFLRESRNVESKGGKLYLSTIFKWYKEDFPPNAVAWIKGQAKDLPLVEPAVIEYRPYDWTLNSQ